MAKNALLTLTDLWRGLGGALDPELPMVCPVLVKKLADKVEFLAEAAREVRLLFVPLRIRTPDYGDKQDGPNSCVMFCFFSPQRLKWIADELM